MGLVLGHKDIFGLWAASFGPVNAQVIGPLMSNETCFFLKKILQRKHMRIFDQKKKHMRIFY